MIDNIIEAVHNSYTNLDYAGLVEETATRDGDKVLRKVNQFGNYEPIWYRNGTLAFVMITGDIEIDSSRDGKTEITITVITDDFYNDEPLISNLDSYLFPNFTVKKNSQDIYYKYFKEDKDKPFTAYAFEITLKIKQNYKTCLEYLKNTSNK